MKLAIFVTFILFNVAYCSYNWPSDILRDRQRTICGQLEKAERLTGDENATDFISKQQWPWMTWFNASHVVGGVCTGVLVTERWVLTSATCAKGIEDLWQVNMRTGDYLRGDNYEFYDWFQERIERVVYHPNYTDTKDPESNLFFNRHPAAYDFALMRMIRSHYMRGGVNTICLPSWEDEQYRNQSLNNRDCQLVGYGGILSRESYPGIQRQHMRPVKSIKSIGDCNSSFPDQANRTDALCVDAESPEHYSHYFFPGSILQCQRPDGRYVLEGVGWDYFYPDMPMGKVEPISDWIYYIVEDGDLSCGASRNVPLPAWIPNPPNFLAPNNYPWMVLIVDENNWPVCNGVLITDTNVVTAARCITDLPNKGYYRINLIAGIYDAEYPLLKTERQTPLVHTTHLLARDFEYHDFYDANQIPVHDFLIMKINGSFHGNPDVSPICLPTLGEEFPYTDYPWRCKLIGWGGIEERFELTGQYYLTQKTVTKIRTDRECPQYSHFARSDLPYCLDVDMKGDKFHHYFYPGAAFVCQEDDGTWKLWGTTSIRNYPMIGVSNVLEGLSFMKYIIYSN